MKKEIVWSEFQKKELEALVLKDMKAEFKDKDYQNYIKERSKEGKK